MLCASLRQPLIKDSIHYVNFTIIMTNALYIANMIFSIYHIRRISAINDLNIELIYVA